MSFKGTYSMQMQDLIKKLRKFANERDWEKFHSPKNLAMALSVEVAEIVEHFQWLTQDQSCNLDARTREKLKDEIGDVLIYLTRLADQLGISPLEAAESKLKKNAAKYPIDKAKGNARKYSEFD
jgi:NTP pyrophosphatase (non-canonical NTP hydrolase)